MNCGVMFYVEKDYPTSLRKFKELLNAIGAEKYIWKIDESDFYNRENLCNILEKKQIKNGEEILKELDCDGMMIWIALEGYRSENDIKELNGSFVEYSESNCETAIFVVDTYRFTVYSKNNSVLSSVLKFAQNNNTGKLEIIGEEHAELYFGV